MDAYFMKDKKTAGSHLDADLESYMADRGKKQEEAAAEAAEDAPAADTEAAAAES